MSQDILLKKIINEFVDGGKKTSSSLTFDYGAKDKICYVPAAVLVPIIVKKKPFLILTKRSFMLNSHPGQISFPGGKVEKNDKNFLETAFRESFEEIGIKKKNFFLIGRLPRHKTITGYEINPFLVMMVKDQKFIINDKEVDEIIKIPLDFFFNLENYYVRYYKNGKNIRKYFTIPYGHYYIWGATAQIIKSLANRIKNEL